MKDILPHMKVIIKTVVVGSNMTEPMVVKEQRKEFNGEMKKYLPEIFGKFKNVFGNFVKDLSSDINFTMPEKSLWKQFLKISRRAHKQFVKGKWNHSVKEVNNKDALYWRQVKDMMKQFKTSNETNVPKKSSSQQEFKTVDEKQYWKDVLKMIKELKKDSKQPIDAKKEEDRKYWRQVKGMMKEFRKPQDNKKEEDKKYWRQVSSLIKSFGKDRMKKPYGLVDEKKESDRTYWINVKRMIKENFESPKKETSPKDVAYWRDVHKMIKDVSIKKKLDQDREFISKPLERKLRKWSPSHRVLNKKLRKEMKPALKMITLISFQSSGNSTKEISKNLKQVLYNVVPYLKEHAKKGGKLNILQVTPLIKEGVKDMIIRDTKLMGSTFRKNMWNLITKLNKHIFENPTSFKMEGLKLPFSMLKKMNKTIKSIRKIDDFDMLADSL